MKSTYFNLYLILLLIGLIYHPLNVNASNYNWTKDHMQIGVRFQPSLDISSNIYDVSRPVISEHSSYVQFWVPWNAIEPTEENTDYNYNISQYLETIECAVDLCISKGLKIEFVFFHCPSWASNSGQKGPWSPKMNYYSEFVTRIATYFKGRVSSYQLYHETNLASMMKDGDLEILINEIFIKGAQAIREVYNSEPKTPVLISTSGMSPSTGPVIKGLPGKGSTAINFFYDAMIKNKELMENIDALNLNVSDQNGFGGIDARTLTVWDGYDTIRNKLDAAQYQHKSIISSESWIVWDNGETAKDINKDNKKDEKDAYLKTLKIYGECLERGLNTLNLPWSDNTSKWSMGLTKLVDFNGVIKQLKPYIVIPSNNDKADIITSKIKRTGTYHNPSVTSEGLENIYTIKNYINPSDPNHLHYYIWKWYAQIAGASDEVIRHTMIGEKGNDIIVESLGYIGEERYQISSYNRTKEMFTVLIYAEGGEMLTDISIPSTIQNGKYYNNENSKSDFRGEGFLNNETYYAHIITKDISIEDGSDINLVESKSEALIVTDNTLKISINNMQPFTLIKFYKKEPVGKENPIELQNLLNNIGNI